MNLEEIKEKLNAFLIDEMEIDEEKVFDGALLRADVGIDSLDYVDIVAFITRNFGFKVGQGDVQKLNTLADLYQYIADNTQKQSEERTQN